MPKVKNDDYLINYEISRPGDGPTLLLVAGLGEQIGSVEYPDEQCDAFAAQGFKVVRMDNRTMGLSVPVSGDDDDLEPFTLHQMADDVAAVIKDLGDGPVHIQGASLGGFIVRWTAIRHPDLVKTVTVVMSGAGAGPDDDGPQVDPASRAGSAGMIEVRSPEDAVDFGVEFWRHLWGKGYPFEEDWVRSRVAYAMQRSYRPQNIEKLLYAAMNTPGLWSQQSEIKHPVLFVHGGEDPYFETDHAIESARQIEGAQVWIDPKMGHIMHREQWEELASRTKKLIDLAP